VARHGRPYEPESDAYDRPAFAADIKEGKNDPIYNAHSYHTKVPPRAISPYILHYTEPGDLVLDPFCGSGMTGGGRNDNAPTHLTTCWSSFPNCAVGLVRAAQLNDCRRPPRHIARNCTPVDVDAAARVRSRQGGREEEFDWLYGPSTTSRPSAPAPTQPDVLCRLKELPRGDSERGSAGAGPEQNVGLVARAEVERRLGYPSAGSHSGTVPTCQLASTQPVLLCGS
jgi:hypothetical protein